MDEEAALGLIRSIEEVKSTAIADWQPSLHLLLKSLSRELEDAVGASGRNASGCCGDEGTGDD